MKKNENGFMLVEFLVVCIFVLGTLIFLTVQFNNINKSYNRSFKYDTVSNIYMTKNVRGMILNDGYDNLKGALATNDFINFTDCSVAYFNSRPYCQALLSHSNIKTALFVFHDLSKLKNSKEYLNLSGGFKTYINTLKSSENGYKILLEFNDNTYSSLDVY